MRARHLLVLAIAGLLHAGVASAAEEPAASDPCDVPSQFRYLTDDLPHVRQAVTRGETLRVVVVGSASTAGAGVGSPAAAYPAQLALELGKRLGNERVIVAVKAKPGQLAADMVKEFKTSVVPARPKLVIWQTGTVDATRGVEYDAFAATLIEGIDLLHKAGTDVILVDMQYSPYTSTMMNLEAYRKQMTWVAQVRDVFLFRRYEIMQYWHDNQILDFGATDKAEQRRTADFVHACIGRLLADAILSTAELAHGAK